MSTTPETPTAVQADRSRESATVLILVRVLVGVAVVSAGLVLASIFWTVSRTEQQRLDWVEQEQTLLMQVSRVERWRTHTYQGFLARLQGRQAARDWDPTLAELLEQQPALSALAPVERRLAALWQQSARWRQDFDPLHADIAAGRDLQRVRTALLGLRASLANQQQHHRERLSALLAVSGDPQPPRSIRLLALQHLDSLQRLEGLRADLAALEILAVAVTTASTQEALEALRERHLLPLYRRFREALERFRAQLSPARSARLQDQLGVLDTALFGASATAGPDQPMGLLALRHAYLRSLGQQQQLDREIQSRFQRLDHLYTGLAEQLRKAHHDNALAMEQALDTVWQRSLLLGGLGTTALLLLALRLARQLGQEMRALREAREAQAARAAAEAATQTKSEFLANMSHELRTPLNAIIGYSEMIREDMADLQQPALLTDIDRIGAAGRHLLGIINDILDISKIEAGKIELHPETFRVRALLDEVSTTVQPLVRENNNLLEVYCAVNVGSMVADLAKVRQILLNLLSNACKFTEEERITIKVGREGDEVVFQVIDRGMGIAPEQLARLFQPFTQVDASSTRRHGGTGLGLAICRHFAELMGGCIDVASTPGEGSVFTLRLPRQLPSHTAVPTPARGEEGDPLVLVVDDDEAVRDLLSRYLSRLGYRIVTASDGTEGLRLAKQLDPVAVTLDVIMPRLDGWSVLATLKSDPQTANIPVIMVSIVDERNTGYALGAADFLVKPVTAEQLAAVLARYRNDSGQQRWVMVVEDHTSTRELLVGQLRRAGWQTLAAANGRVALEQLQERIPDLLILDLIMPEMDGFELIRRLRESPRWARIPVVVLTARDLTPEDRRFLNDGVARVFCKGAFPQEQLLEQIRHSLSELLP